MTLAALSGFAGLILIVFGARTIIQLGRTGTSGWRLAPTRAARAGDALFAVGVLGTLASPALVLADAIGRLPVLDAAPLGWLGVPCLLVGAGVAVTAQAQMGAAWRAGIDFAADGPLVTRGLFRVVRNPFYLGICLAAGGAALMVPTWVSLIAELVLVTGCNIDVRLVEEPHLRARHGTRFDAYAARTPRFVPALRSRR